MKVNKIETIHNATKNLLVKPKQRDKDVNNISEPIKQKDLKNILYTQIKSHHVSLKHSALTPSVKRRTKAVAKPVTPLQEARTRLHISTVPKSLPCREEQFNDIYTFLESKLMDNSGG